MDTFPFLRPFKGIELKNCYNNPFVLREDLQAFSYTNAVVLPQRNNAMKAWGLGGVLDENDTYIEISGLGAQFGGYYAYEGISVSESRVCYCGYLINHWGHFLLDAVSRLWYALEHDTEDLLFVYLVGEDAKPETIGNYREFFELFGIEDRIRIINKPVKYKEVIIPERAFIKGEYYSKYFLSVFDKVKEAAINEDERDLPEKIYLSRNHFRGKKVESGLDFVDHYFSKNGFEVIYPEEISLSRMIRLIHGAKICAAESGTLTHNFLFSEEGKELIIVERQVTVNDYQCEVDIARGLKPIYIDANYEIYTTSVGYGPYLLGYTKCFKRFTETYGFLEPDTYYTSEKYIKKCLRKYIKACDREYGYKRQYASWQMIARRAIMEAYEEALEKFRPWLEKTTPLFWWQIFQIRYIKAFMKKLLK